MCYVIAYAGYVLSDMDSDIKKFTVVILNCIS